MLQHQLVQVTLARGHCRGRQGREGSWRFRGVGQGGGGTAH